jgi:tetratricopeptide (TPR) repeat protein
MSNIGQGPGVRRDHLAEVIPLWRSARPDDLASGLEKLARDIGATLAELVATATAHHLEVPMAVQFAAIMLNEPPAGPQGKLDWPATAGTLATSSRAGDDEVRRRSFFTAAGGLALSAMLGRPSDAIAAPTDQPVPVGDQAAILTSITGQYRRLEATTPAGRLLDAALAHLRFTTSLADHAASPDLQARLAAAASEAGGFAGWLAVDLGDHAAARRRYREAVEYASRSGQALLEAYMLGSMSLWAAGLGNGSEAMTLIQKAHAALPPPGRVLPTANVWVALIEATAHASRQDANAALAALGRAEAATAQAQQRHEPVWPWVYAIDEAKVASYRGGCLTKLKRPKQALPALTQALAAAEPATKQRALLLCDLATCHAFAGEPEEAARQAVVAFGIGGQCGSAKVVQQVCAVRTQVAATGHRRALAYLDERLLAGMLTES